MKAIVFERYGSPDVLEFKDVHQPIPKEDEVLIKIAAASVNAADWASASGRSFPRAVHGGTIRTEIPYSWMRCGGCGGIRRCKSNEIPTR